MAKIGFYPTPDNAAYLTAHAGGKPTRFLNAVIDFHRRHHAQDNESALSVALVAALAEITQAIRALEAHPPESPR